MQDRSLKTHTHAPNESRVREPTCSPVDSTPVPSRQLYRFQTESPHIPEGFFQALARSTSPVELDRALFHYLRFHYSRLLALDTEKYYSLDMGEGRYAEFFAQAGTFFARPPASKLC